MHLTLDDLANPPLPDRPIADAWRTYLAFWSAGRRRDGLAAVTEFVDRLDNANRHARAAFAQWLCELLFDQGEDWSGQFGGGLLLRDGRWIKPAEFALTVHQISLRVTVPYLLEGLRTEDTRYLRWAYQFAIGLAYRLPPREQRQLRSAIESRCGTGAAPIDLLRLAVNDARAQHMLSDAEHD